MTTCDEARSELNRAQKRVEDERGVLSRYQQQMSNLEKEHTDLTRRWKDASALVVENEREWDRAREHLRTAIEALREKKEKLAYWDGQKRRFDNGETTDYSGASNERSIIYGQRDDASNAVYDAEQVQRGAEDEVRSAKDRFDRSQSFLQDRANDKFANEDKQSTLRNRIDIQNSAVRDAESWKTDAQRTVDQVC